MRHVDPTYNSTKEAYICQPIAISVEQTPENI